MSMTRCFVTHTIRSTFLVGSLFIAGSAPLYLTVPATAAPTINNATPYGPIQALYNGLQHAENRSDIEQRRAVIAPAVDQAFDLSTILRRSIGLRYDRLSDSERQQLLSAFRAFTVARYASTFKPESEAVFSVRQDTIPNPTGGVIVHTSLRGKSDPSSDATAIDYVMVQSPQGWRITDILLDGHISQVGAQRSDFKTIFSQSGARGLAQSLTTKADNFLHE